MTPHVRNILGLSLVLAWLAGCGGGQPEASLSYADEAERAYEAAMVEFRDDNCLEAEPAFRSVRKRFPYSNYAALAELRIADCLFKEDKYLESIQAYRQFVRHHPSHDEVPYASFRIALAYYEQIPEGWLLSPPVYERDQSDTERALEALRRFIAAYPDDPRAEEAKRLAQKSLRLLAQHEMYVADFYLDRDAPDAAVGRLKTVVDAFRGSGLEAEALWLLAKVYRQALEEPALAKERLEQLVEEFPYADEAEGARVLLRDLGK